MTQKTEAELKFFDVIETLGEHPILFLLEEHEITLSKHDYDILLDEQIQKETKIKYIQKLIDNKKRQDLESNMKWFELKTLIYDKLKALIIEKKGIIDIRRALIIEIESRDKLEALKKSDITELQFKLESIAYLEITKDKLEEEPQTELELLEDFESIIKREQKEKINLGLIGTEAQKGDLITIGARSGLGKTSLALQIAIEQAQDDKKVGFFSLEMTEKQVIKRIVQHVGELEESELVGGCKEALEEVKSFIHNFKIYKNIGITYMDIIEKIRAYNDIEKFDIIYIDYIQLLSGLSDEIEYTTVTNISKNLRWLALELNIVIVGIAQLNRQGAENRTANMSQLKGSGQIEQDSSLIVLLDNSQKKDNYQTIDIKIDKNRHGARKSIIDCVFLGEYYKFIPPREVRRTAPRPRI